MPDRHQRWTLRVVCVSTALLLLNVAAPQVAQSAIAESLGASFTDLQWVLSGYALALAVFLLTAGSLADRFGRRRLFLIGLTLFSTASGLCAIAPDSGALIGARILQGLGAAVVFPSSLAILAEAFQGADRRRAIGAWGATIGLAFAAGPLIGGLLVDLLGWRAIFATSFVLGAPMLMLAARQVHESRDPDPPPVDWAGVGTLSVGLFAGVFAVLRGNALGWTSTTVLGCLALCALSLSAFVVVERATARPMLDLGLFRNRTFTGATAVVALLAGGPFGAFVYVTLFLLDVQERDPVEAGLVLAPLALVSFVVSAVAGRMSERVPLRGALLGGMLVTAAGMLALRAGISEEATWLALLPGLSITGLGVGLANPLTTFAHLGVLPPAQGGLASALNNTARQIGLAIGIAVLGTLLEAGLEDGGGAAAFADGVGELLLISAALSLLGALAAALLVRPRDLWAPPAR
ncbi:MAG TPA: DHA2 family efflux MFS transporter permease subunit [Solirubrobacteraceae bacterium]|nr:DHA2 family efflux MFS transporter permease subunit [Solirubrobacteraceae bacterium]